MFVCRNDPWTFLFNRIGFNHSMSASHETNILLDTVNKQNGHVSIFTENTFVMETQTVNKQIQTHIAGNYDSC